MIEELKAQFVEDAKELLKDLENKIFDLESNALDKSVIEDVFRVMHNLKGASGMYGFDNIGKLTHDLETVYDLVREGVVSIDKQIIDVTFASVDILKELLANQDDVSDKLSPRFNHIVADIEELVTYYLDAEAKPTVPKEKNEKTSFHYIILKPFREIFSRGVNLNYFFEDVASLGEYASKMHNTKLSIDEQFEKKECLGVWEIVLKSSGQNSNIDDLFMFFLEGEFAHIPFDDNFENSAELQALISENITDSSPKESIKFIREFWDLFATDTVAPPDIPTDLHKKQDTTEPAQEKKTVSKTEETIRVPSKKLDILMNLVSELVTTKAHLSLIAESVEEPRLMKAIEGVDKLSKQLSDLALDIRLMPLESLIVNFKRLVRDVSSSLDKKVHFEIEGAETELDKTIISGLEKPLMHILRNAIDHGLENKEVRLQCNKPEEGMVKLIAFYSGSNVFIQIQDDGGGINKKKVLEKAISKGLIKPDDKLTDRDIYNLLFLPGFSTAEKLSDISGRGVGMDVVKSQIEDLRGEVDITTEEGLGTTFTLKLPLTLSIIDTLHVKINEADFLIPLSDVEGCINKSRDEFGEKQNSVILQDKLIPMINLRKAFSMPELDSKFQKLVIIQKEDKTIGLTVDEVIGEHQAVLKTLGEVFRKQDFISGASIMGDGSVSLVLDTNKLSGLVSNFVEELEEVE